MTRIALIVDHPQRDLAGLVLTAFRLCQEGITCHLVPLNLQDRELWALAPDFVLLNYARTANETLARALIKAGIKVGVLDTEGGMWGTLEKYSELLWLDRALLRQLKCFCAWGPAIGNHLVAAGLIDQDQLSITGCPRFDLYHPAWRTVVLDQPRDEPDKPKRILINTNFSFANPQFASIEGHIKQYQRELGWSVGEITGMIERGRAGIDATIELARNLARHFPSAQIVLRPHPFEQDSYYRMRFAGIENVTVDRRGTIQKQIYRADAIIQRSCTTAVEAGMASIPTLSPQWVTPEMEVPAAEEVSITCKSYFEMRNTLEEILNGRYQRPAPLQRAINAVINKWFLSSDGRAHERVSNEIHSSLKGPREVNEKLCLKRQYGLDNQMRISRKTVGSHARYYLGFSPDWSFRYRRCVPEINWTNSEKCFGVAIVQKLAERIYSIYRTEKPALRPVEVSLARNREDYLRSYHGHTVTMTSSNR